MNTGTITQVTLAKTGKSYRVKIGNEWYGAKKDSGLNEQSAGKTISYETETGDYGTWITKWGSASNGNGGQQQAAPSAPTSGVNLAFLPFVSNVVAHAIQCGRIEGPADIQAWADAAYSAAHNLKAV